MKNIIKLFSIAFVALSLSSCDKDPDNVIYEVLEFEKGAVLRTIGAPVNNLNGDVPSTTFTVTLEEQDDKDGALLESVDVFVTLRDLTSDNGTTVAPEGFIKNIPASAFTVGPVGLPRITVSVTVAEAAAALGISRANNDFKAGDIFVFEFRLNLTDGRVFGANDAGGIITGGFFASPYKYNALLSCSPQPGVYTIEMRDSYGDGWQTNDGTAGDGITITLDDGTVFEVGLCNAYNDSQDDFCTPNDGYTGTATITIPEGTESAKWFFPGDAYGEIAFKIIGPGGEVLFDADFGDTNAGQLPITLCRE